MANHRIFFAVQEVAFAVDGTTTFVAAHGVQSVGMTTTINLENVFEMGQVAVYEIIEQVPEVSVNLEKVIDGNPLLYHLATSGATDTSLVGRSNVKTTMCLSVFSDSSVSATGTPLAEVSLPGLVVTSVGYAAQVDGAVTESLGLVGNVKTWRNVAGGDTAQITGAFNNADKPANDSNGSGGVQKRNNVLFVPWTGLTSPSGVDENGQTNAYTTVLPTDIFGVSSSGTNPPMTGADAGSYAVPVQSINISCDLNRESVFELGKLFPYCKYVNFPVEVRSEIEVLATQMDNISLAENGGVNGAPAGSNAKYQSIRLQLKDGTIVDAGTRNKLTNVAWAGGDARQGGGNVTNRFSYTGQNALNVYHPSDPSALAPARA